jgi:cytochrome c oxidase cbb3-type subunit 3
MAKLPGKSIVPGVVLMAALTLQIPAQAPPAGGRGNAAARASSKFDQASVDRGKEVFGPNCGFCHGLTARGGDGGPDLARSLFVLSDDKGQQVSEILKTGRIGQGMPAFPNLSQAQSRDIAEFLHERVEAARNREGTTPPNIVTGDAGAGVAYFNGAGGCGGCHSASGDLKGIGSKYEPVALQDRFLSPRGGRGGGGGRGVVGALTRQPTARTVKVTTPSGQSFAGTLIGVSDFAVTLRDADGQRRTFSLEGNANPEGSPTKVEIIDPLQAHLDLLTKISDKDIHNLTAYLVTLK